MSMFIFLEKLKRQIMITTSYGEVPAGRLSVAETGSFARGLRAKTHKHKHKKTRANIRISSTSSFEDKLTFKKIILILQVSENSRQNTHRPDVLSKFVIIINVMRQPRVVMLVFCFSRSRCVWCSVVPEAA